MRESGNTILITGGGSGIGLGLAGKFLADNNTVIICGRRGEVLRHAKEKHPGLIVRACDIADAREREDLYRWCTVEYPAVNVLVNNAGIQRRFSIIRDKEWPAIQAEFAINLEAPVHLCSLFVDHLQAAGESAIINIGSGLAFVPMAAAPVYCATKAGLHSFTQSLRHQLSGTQIQVIEIHPPAVDTDLGGPGLHSKGTPLQEFTDAAYARIRAGKLEFGYGFSEKVRTGSHEELAETFRRMNPVKKPAEG